VTVLRDYALPLVLALALHGAVVGLMMHNWQSAADAPSLAMPRMVQATLVVMEKPKPKPKPPEAKPPPPSEPASPAPPKPKPKPEPQVEPPPKPDLEAERREREEQERRRRLQELLDQSTQMVLEDELFDLGDAEDVTTMSYVADIMNAIIAEWSRPPSARNDMQARFRVDLLPSGDLLNVTLVDSSGNGAFDRSAEAAVRKVDRFNVPSDRRLFESKFRRFTLLFKPEDLLR